LYQSAIKYRCGFVQPSPAFLLHSCQRRRALVPGEDDFLIGILGVSSRLFSRSAFLLLFLYPPTHLLFLRFQSLGKIAILALEPAAAVIFHRFFSLPRRYAHYHCARVSRLRGKLLSARRSFTTKRKNIVIPYAR